MKSIDADELDKDMASTEQERKAIDEAVLSKTWRLLRVTSKTKLALFDKINNGKELHNLFQVSEPNSENDMSGQKNVASGIEISADAS